MATTSPEPGTLFQFDDPPDQSPVIAKDLRDNFTALARTNYTTDKSGPLDNVGNVTPAFPKAPRDGMARLNASNPNNVGLEFWLPGTGGGSAWRRALSFLNLGLGAVSKQIIAFPGAPTPPNPWQVDHNIGSQVLVAAFDVNWFMFEIVAGGGGAIPVPTKFDKSLGVGAPTTGNFASTALLISAAPFGYAGVSVNGISYAVGDGVKTKDCYFSGDGGVTARAQGAIQAGDVLYWNGVIAGFDLNPTMRIDFFYSSAQTVSLTPTQCIVQQATPNRVLVTFAAPTAGNLVIIG
jgi:hypothetical protein